MTRSFVFVLGLFGILTVMTACETVKGAGRDLETAGEAIQQESAEVQAEM